MKKLVVVIRALLIVAVAAPIAVYVYVFGPTLSVEHSRWAEFGSAIGGIYSPIVAILTLFVLAKQVSLQAQTHTHETDQAYIQQARENIDFYCVQMANAVASEVLPGKPLRLVLCEHFLPHDAAALSTTQLHELARDIHTAMPASFDIWAAVYPILTGLAIGETSMYRMTLGSATQKLIALLSFETCVALDNFHFARTQGHSKVDYAFSPLLSKPVST